ERSARCVAVTLLSLERNSPLEVTKTTPLMIVGTSGATKSRETQPGCRVGAPFCSTIFQATTAPLVTTPLVDWNPNSSACVPTVGARIQRVPLASCQLASALGANSPPLRAAGVVVTRQTSQPPTDPDAALAGSLSFAASSRCTRPSLVVVASSVLPL